MALELDVFDKKILEQLESNARQSNAQVSKKVALSKDAVGYRIKNLEKSKIILGYYSVLNISRLGYSTFKLMLSFQNTTSVIEEEIIQFFRKSQHVGWLVSCDGFYNLMAVAWVKNATVFDNFFSGFLKKYSQFIRKRDIILIIENHSCEKAFLFGKKQDDSEDIFYSGEQANNVDETDLKIIKLIANDSRMQFQKIASSVGLTGEAIAHRIKQLQSKHIIQAFRPIINTSLLGYEYYNVLFRLKKFDNIKRLFSFFKAHPNIIYFVKYLGSFDVGIDVEVKNSNELRQIMSKIKNLFSEDIESYNAVLIYQQHKLSYFPE